MGKQWSKIPGEMSFVSIVQLSDRGVSARPVTVVFVVTLLMRNVTECLLYAWSWTRCLLVLYETELPLVPTIYQRLRFGKVN